VEVFAIFQGDLGVVGNDLVFSRPLEKENVTEGDASQVLLCLCPGVGKARPDIRLEGSQQRTTAEDRIALRARQSTKQRTNTDSPAQLRA